MEINEDGFLEELLSLRRETWETNPPLEINGLYSTLTWPFNGLDSTPTTTILPNSTSHNTLITSTIEPSILDWSTFPDLCIHTSSPMILPDTALFPACPSAPSENGVDWTCKAERAVIHACPIAPFEKGVNGTCKTEPTVSNNAMIPSDTALFSACPITPSEHGADGTCKAEPAVSDDALITAGSFNIGLCMERSNASQNSSSNNNRTTKMKKVDGQPSKNLMAERRRRKRLNDRLSMLRSVVPKISKMDRTSILGDTIEYMKELRDKINSLQGEIDVSIFNDVKPNNVVLVKNSPKFDVERRELDTRVEMCCGAKPGLLLSTLTTLEALGLDIQQCVISCFNDFSLHASCFEEIEQRNIINSEDIKQALFRNAGYGGKCL